VIRGEKHPPSKTSHVTPIHVSFRYPTELYESPVVVCRFAAARSWDSVLNSTRTQETSGSVCHLLRKVSRSLRQIRTRPYYCSSIALCSVSESYAAITTTAATYKRKGKR
jgi:hypothetical protein